MRLSTALLMALAACVGDPIAPPPVASAFISPANPLVVVTDTLRLDAAGRDSSGAQLGGRAVKWSSSDTTVATVSATGEVVGRAPGTVDIRAVIEQHTATTRLSVLAAPIPGRVKDFFMALSWPGNVYTTPIPTQPEYWAGCPPNSTRPCLHENVYRQQWNGMWDPETVADWAADPGHRGHLYSLGDDVASLGFGGIYANDPKRYAADYCAFVTKVQKVDPTAEFGISMLDVITPDAWMNDVADGIVAAYTAHACGTKPVSEWTFNIYGHWSDGPTLFEDQIQRRITWALTRPAPAGAPVAIGLWVLGWTGDDIPNDDPRYLDRMREVKAWLFATPNLRMARYIELEQWPTGHPDPHPLEDAAGQLNATGRTYAEVTGRIAGPQLVRPGASCLWIPETTGGPPPFTYEWLVNGSPAGKRPWLALVNAGSRFTIEMRVTDASGGHSSATMKVEVSGGAPPCAQ